MILYGAQDENNGNKMQYFSMYLRGMFLIFILQTLQIMEMLLGNGFSQYMQS